MDISKNYLPNFFLVGLVFFLFFFLLSILGFFFLFHINKYIRRKEGVSSISSLEQLFLSFGIGLSIYISLSYLLDLCSLFNFYTAYLSIIIFDILFILYYSRKNLDKLKIKLNKDTFKDNLKRYFLSKDNIFYLVILIFTLITIFTIQWIIITESTSLNYTDPFKWYTDTFYLLDNGHIDYYNVDYNYPAGYTFFNAGVLLIYPDYLFGYYYFKFIPLYFIFLYIIITFKIIRKLFNERYLILLSLLLLLTSRYFLSRTLLYLASSLASGLLIISLLIIINKYPDYLLGFFIAGLYLIHSLTAFYYLFVLSGFYLFRFVFVIRGRKNFIEQFKSIIILIFIIFILLTPYLLSIYYIYNDTIFDFFYYFIGRFEQDYYASTIEHSKHFSQGLIKLIYPLEYFKPFIDVKLLDIMDDALKRSIYFFFICSFIGLFISLKPKKGFKEVETLIFFKFFIITIIIIFFLPFFFQNLQFFIKFRKRILESFSLPIIIMALYAIEWIVNLSKKFTDYLILKFNVYRNLINSKKFYSKLIRIESIIVIFLIASTSSSFMIHRYPDYYYYYEDELVEVVLYLRTHAESNSKILREDFDSAVIFRMLYDMKIKKFDVNETSSYEDLKNEIHERDIDYLIFSKDYFDNNTIEDSLCDSSRFKELLENDEYILFKYKR